MSFFIIYSMQTGGMAMRRTLWLTILLALLPWAALAEMTVHFLDVGHGDCAILQCDGETMIIDGGNSGQSQLVYAYLQELGVTRVDVAVATHPDGDHIGGLPAVFHAAEVGVLYTPVLTHESSRFTKLMEAAETQHVPMRTLRAGDSFPLGGAVAEVLSPAELAGTDENDWSIVLRVIYGERVFLFCADAGNRIERQLVAEGAELSADVMKVSHHGSDSGTLMQFVLAVSPEYAVISGDTRYDNPDDETVLKLLYGGAHLLHTLQNGHIVMSTDGEALTVSSQRYYVANINTLRYHRVSCGQLNRMSDNHRMLLFTQEEAIFRQLDPCDHCQP